MAQGSQEERSCPVDGCDNPELDEISDMDDQFDWFCHWCGNMFVENEGDLDVQ
jgi:hypothetical protein